MSAIDAGAVSERLAAVRHRIAAAGGDPDRVRVVAVTKGFGLEAPQAALEAGLDALGENYADELVAKAEAIAALVSASQRPLFGGVVPRWHFIGAIQRNKIRRLAAHVACYEGVDRLVEAEAIAAAAPGAAVLVEVDTTGAPGRSGVPPEAVAPLVADVARLGLDVRGLMTVAPAGGGPPARAAFATVARLADHLGLPERSMGMSDDLEAAIAEGATSVRIGRALFGPRPARGQVPQ